MRPFRAILLLPFAFAACAVMAQSVGIQPRVEESLAKAEALAMQGKIQEAEAYAKAASVSRLRVEVDLSQAPISRRADCEAAVREAISAWSEALGGLVSLELAAPGQGDVKIRFRENVHFAGTDAAGLATWSRQVNNWGGWFSAQLTGTIDLRWQLRGEQLNLAEMRHAAMHELGHMLGLEDAGSGIMGPLRRDGSVVKPSDAEISALLELHVSAARFLPTSQAGITLKADHHLNG